MLHEHGVRPRRALGLQGQVVDLRLQQLLPRLLGQEQVAVRLMEALLVLQLLGQAAVVAVLVVEEGAIQSARVEVLLWLGVALPRPMGQAWPLAWLLA